MAKKIEAYIKLQVPAGEANPSPPVGPALGQHGVNIMEFCKAFNGQTQKLEKGMPTPVVITVYSDRSFTFITKTPPAPECKVCPGSWPPVVPLRARKVYTSPSKPGLVLTYGA